MVNSNKAVFLDRDGVLVKSFVKKGKAHAPIKFKDFKIYKDSEKCIKKLNSLGFMTIVVTNQPDVGKKLISKATLKKMHNTLKRKTKINKIYTCIHTLEQKCNCRKPMPGMLIEAAKVNGINLKKSYMIGDRFMDILCGSKVGCKTIFINRNYKEKKPTKQIASVRNLREATICIASRLEK
jgi:D-glycero-D-manno-heptose 1,7-bisphosphate phosphatase